MNIANSGSLLANEGLIKAVSFETQGSSSFYNSGETIISGKSSLSSTNQKWENQGYFKTGEMEIVATSSQLLNACKLYIDGLFNIHTGNGADNYFSVDGGGYVECENLYMDQAEVRLGEKAFVNVKGEAKFKHNTKGIKGIGSDYALLKMGSAVQENVNQGFSITYQGNLYVACDNHFAQGHDGNPTHPYINYIGDNVQMTGADNAEISIPASSCNPGYNSTPGETPDAPVTYTYAFEDMTKEAGDYDFNDVVLEVTTPKDGQVTINLVAAGASKKLQVRLKKNQSESAEVIFEDVHTAMNVSAGTLVNTGYASGTVATKVITVGEDFTLAENGDFYIADANGEVHIPQFTARFAKGNVPFAICVPVAWKWPKEYISIDKAYGDFAAWAQDATQNVDWYSKNWNSDKVMK